MNNERIRKQLNEIVSICRDGAKGYAHAADNLNDPELSTLFRRLAQQRKGFVEELKNEGLKLGMELDDSGTIKGYFHRIWMDVSYSFDSNDENVIEDSITGEEKAVEIYKEVMNEEGIPQYLWDTLNNQFGLIRGAMNQLKALEKEVA